MFTGCINYVSDLCNHDNLNIISPMLYVRFCFYVCCLKDSSFVVGQSADVYKSFPFRKNLKTKILR